MDGNVAKCGVSKMTFRNGISVCPSTRPETFPEIRWGVANAGLVVAELENMFTIRAQAKNRATRLSSWSKFSLVRKKTQPNNQCTPNRRNPEEQKRRNVGTQNPQRTNLKKTVTESHGSRPVRKSRKQISQKELNCRKREDRIAVCF